jgi:hypothetical protein
VLDPARLRKNLAEGSLRLAVYAAVLAQQDRARTSGALIQG